MALWDDIVADPEFQEQPQEVKDQVADNFFAENIGADTEFQLQSDDVKSQVRQNFFSTVRPAEPVAEPEPERTLAGTIKDIGVAGLSGIIGLPEALVGLADIPTGGRVGKFLEEEVGFKPVEAREILAEGLSPAQKAAQERVGGVEGFFPKVGAAIKSPSVIVQAAIESAPSIVGGAGLARGILAAAPKISPIIAAAAGEGLITAGAATEEVRASSKDGLITFPQAAATAASGLVTGALSLAGGRLAQKLGVTDVDTLLAGQVGKPTQKGVVRRVLEGGISEGAFEELPQSAQEQIWLNAAQGKPLLQGVDQASAMGLLTGATIGGGFNVFRTGTLTEAEQSQDQIAESYVEAQVADGSLTREQGDAIIGGFRERSTPESTQEDNAQILDGLIDEVTLPEAEVVDPVAATAERVQTQVVEAVEAIEPKSEVAAQVKELLREEVAKIAPEPIVAEEELLPEAEIVTPVTPEVALEPPLPEVAPVIPPEVELPPAPTTPIQLSVEEGVAILDDQNRQLLEAIRAEVETGEAGRRVPVRTAEGEVLGIAAEASTFPEFFKDRGLKKKPTLTALNKALAGKKLAPGQERNIRELHEAFQRFRPEQLAELEDFETIQSSDLTEGQSFAFEGQTFTVRGIGDDGTITLVDDQGQASGLLPDEEIDIDRGTLTTVEVAPEAPVEPEVAPAGPERVRIGKSPQAFEVIRELEQTPEEKELGERFFEIRNEKTKEVQTVEFEEMKPIKAKKKPVFKIKEKELKVLPGDGIFTVEELEGRIKDGLYIHDIIPESAKEASKGSRIEDASNVARRVLKTVAAEDGKDFSKTVQSKRKEAASKIREAEASALRKFAEENNLIIDDFAETLEIEGDRGRTENHVYKDESTGRYMKANRFTHAHTFADLFDNMMIHNDEFESEAYRLEGFTEIKGEFLPVFSQLEFRETGEVDGKKLEKDAATALESRGFKREEGPHGFVSTARFVSPTKAVVSDINEGNVARVGEAILFFDPVVSMDAATKMDRIKRAIADAKDVDQIVEKALPFKKRKVAKKPKEVVSRKEVEASVKEITKDWTNSPPIKVVSSASQLPAEIAEEVKLSKADGQVQGLFDPETGTIYLVTDNISSTDQAEKVLFHEAIGHLGVMEVLGDDINSYLDQVYRKHQHEADDIANTYGFDVGRLEGRREAAAEVLANLAETNTDPSLVKKAIAIIREWLRKAKFKVKLSDNDIRSMLADAAQVVRRPEKSLSVSGPVVFSRNLDPPDKRLKELREKFGVGPAPQKATEDAYDTSFNSMEENAKEEADVLKDSPETQTLEKDQKGVYKTFVDKVQKTFDKLDPLGDLPEKAGYLKERNLVLGKLAKISDTSKQIYDAFSKATPEQAETIYEFLTNADIKPSVIKNKQQRADAVEVKRAIIKTGEDLVARGLLDKQTFLSMKGAYLPRIYLKHLLPEKEFVAMGEGKKPSDMGWSKKRKDIPEDVRRLILGEITDPGYLASKGFGQQQRDMAMLDWLEVVSKNKQWTLDKSLVKWKGQKVTPFWLKNEADRIRRQAKFYVEKDRKEALEISNKMADIADEALSNRPGVPDNFKQMPDTPRYGALRGMIVRKEIFDDIAGASNVHLGDASIAEKILGNGGLATKFTQLWKWSKVAANPPGQVRNFVSNGILLHLSGVPFHKVPLRVVEAVKSIRRDGEAWKVAKKHGVTQSTFSSQELVRIERELLDIEARRSGAVSLATFKNMAGKIIDLTGDMYQLSESIFKTAKIIDEMKKGKSPADAALEAQKWLFDYSLVTPSMRYLRNAPVGVPFLCVDDQTEILTQRGWLNKDDVREGDIAASFNMKTEIMEWKPVLSVYRADYEGKELMYFNDRHLDMAMTPDHRCVTYRRRRVPGKRAENAMHLSLELQQAQDLNVRDHIPTAAPFLHKPIGSPVSDDMVEMVGWYITEGTAHPKCGQITISQNEGEDLDRIRSLTEKMGFTYRTWTARFKGGNFDHVFIQIHAKYGYMVREFAPNKHLTSEFLMRLTSKQIKLLVDTMIKGDGHVYKSDGRRCFIQNPGETLESFQMALSILGLSYNVRNHGENCKVILIREGKNYCVKRAKKELKPYHGQIWCPMIADNETWLARRNGKPFITHNTFYMKALPRLMEVLLTNPLKFAPYAAIPYALTALISNMTDADDDDVDKLRKALPKWLEERGNAYILPAKDAQGRWVAIDVGYFFPWAMWTDMAADAGRGEFADVFRGTGIFSGPLPDMITAIKTNVDPFTKKPIINEFDSPEKQIASMMGYLYQMSAPTWLTNIGFTGHMYRALSGAVDKYGEPKTNVTQAALRLAGVNLYPIDPVRTRNENIRWMNFEISQVKRRRSKLLKDRNFTPAERKSIRQEYQEMIGRRKEELRRYKVESQVVPQLR